MKKKQLTETTHIDLTKEALSYEAFAELAQNPYLSDREKVGFPDAYRSEFEPAILADISAKLEFPKRKGARLLDIGCGASPLTDGLLNLAEQCQIDVYLNDSAAMLANLNSTVKHQQIPGKFPQALAQVAPLGFDLILTYSVVQYVIADGAETAFVEAICQSLNHNGIALIGDIPNESKRKRFFQSEQGIAFHKAFMQTDLAPTTDFEKLEREGINDSHLNALVRLAQGCGCHAYVVPQSNDLPMANRRDDILIYKL